MTAAEAMDLRCTQEHETELARELCRLNQKLDYIVTTIDGLHHRVESLEEIREDLWPMVQGMSHQISRRLHELDQNGTLGFVKESVKMAEVVATSFDEEDVRLLGQNIVSILKTVRSMTQPEVMEIADRAATALKEGEAHPEKKIGLFRALRDPEVRRGMTLMLTVLRELGTEGTNDKAKAIIAG